MDADDHFGLCPECHKTNGYLNAGAGHWFYCVEHKVFWCAGFNLFSSWREETEAEQYAAWVDRLSGFVDITGRQYHHPYYSAYQH